MSFWSARAALFLLVGIFRQAHGSDFFNKSIDISNPNLVFFGDWVVESNSTSNLTVTRTDKIGATVSFNFTGTQIYVISDNGIDNVGNSAVGANYSIDGGTPVTRIANLTHQGNETIVFASSELPYQNHTFLITVADIPFYDLSGFNITTSNTSPATPSTSASTTSSKAAATQRLPSTTMSPPSKHAISKGAIAGIVVGALLLLITLFGLCFYLSRWHRRQRQLYEAKRVQRSYTGGNVPTYTSPPPTSLLGKSTPMSPENHGRKHSDREFHSPTSTLVETTSPPPGGGAPIRRPSNNEQSMLPEVKPPGGLFSRYKEAKLKPNVKKQKKEEPYPDIFRL